MSSTFKGAYPSYYAASEACGDRLYSGGENDLIEAETLLTPKKMTTKNANRLIQYLGALSFSPNPSVLDFGGSSGKYYDSIKALGLDPQWDILELPEKVALANQFGASDKKRFFANVWEVQKNHYSHVIFGAVLQILPDPERTLRQVLQYVQWEYLFITHFPLVVEWDVVTIKRKKVQGKRADHPYHLFSNKWRGIFEEFGEIILECNTPDITIRYDRKTHPYKTFLIKKR